MWETECSVTKLRECVKDTRTVIRIKSFFEINSVGKESACNAGDPVWFLGQEASPGEGIGYPLQYSSLVAQLVTSLPAMRETWVWSLGWEDPLEKGKVTHSSILAWRFHGLYSPWGWLHRVRHNCDFQFQWSACIPLPFAMWRYNENSTTWSKALF